MERLDDVEAGCWINVSMIDDEDAAWLVSKLGVVGDFIESMRDREEVSRTDKDVEADQELVVVDYPVCVKPEDTGNPDIEEYDTEPVSIVLMHKAQVIITSTVSACPLFDAVKSEGLDHMDTSKRTRFLLSVLLEISQKYIDALRVLEKETIRLERKMRKVQRNSGLMSMLGIEKSLLYISTSLKSAASTLEMIRSGGFVRLYDADQELLDDVMIEYKQASEMCSIYTDVVTKAMDAFTGVVSNNVNTSMGLLTMVTLLLSIPTVIFSFYGMNTGFLPLSDSWIFPTALAAVLAAIAIVILARWRKRL